MSRTNFKVGWRDAVTWLALTLLPFLFFWRILTPRPFDRSSFPAGDFNEEFYVWQSYLAQALHSGRIPLWNPFIFAGHPFLADIQTGVLYPFNWLVVPFAHAGYRVSYLSIEGLVILHFVIASLGMYLLGRRLLQRRTSAFLAALVFTYAGFLTTFPIEDPPVLYTWVWLPITLLLLDKALTHVGWTGRVRWGLWAALPLLLAVLGGHPQTLLLEGYTLLGFALYRAWQQGGRNWRSYVYALLPLALMVGVGFALAMVQLLPTAELVRLSNRVQTGYDFAASGFPWREALSGLLLPAVFNNYLLYVGIGTFVLAIVAILHSRDRLKPFFIMLLIGSFLLSVGGNSFFYSLLYLGAPGFSLFRDQERAVGIFTFAAAMLSGLGVDALFQDLAATSTHLPMGMAPRQWLPAFTRRLWPVFGVALVLEMLLFFYRAANAWITAANTELNRILDGYSYFLVVLLLLLAVLELARRTPRTALLPLLLIALTGGDLFSSNWKNNLDAGTDPASHYPQTSILTYLQAHRDEGRVYNDLIYPNNYGSLFGIYTEQGISPFELQRYDDLFFLIGRDRFLQLFSTTFALTRTDYHVSPILQDRDVYLYARPAAPRAWIARTVLHADQDGAVLALLNSTRVNLQTTAVVPTRVPLPDNIPGPGGAARILRDEGETLQIQASASEPALLVLADSFYPGWEATIDGVPTPIYQVDYMLRGIILPTGEHQVMYRYRPHSLAIGAIISVITLLLFIVVQVGLGLLMRRQKVVGSPAALVPAARPATQENRG